jgi:glutamate racemase
MKIGIYDSGLGGIQIMRAVRTLLPQYEYVFYGDTALLPLGDKSEEVIYNATIRGVRTLFARDCTIVLIACNTASVATARKIQDTLIADEYPDRRVLGVVIPTVESVIDSGAQRVLVIGTMRTIGSAKYEQEIHARNPDIRCVSIATPKLVPLIESGYIDDAVLSVSETVEQERTLHNIDTVVLACTHYNVLKRALRERFGSGMRIVAQDEIIPVKFENYLERHPEIHSNLSRGGTEIIYLTKDLPHYGEVLGR